MLPSAEIFIGTFANWL